MNAPYEYEISLPAGYQEEGKYPVVFLLHGKGSDERDMLSLAGPLSSEFVLISIRGDFSVGTGYQFYELKSIGNPIREQFDQAVEKLERFITYASERYPIDPERRYFMGFSQGAILSMSLGLSMGEAIKGIVALNGYVPEFVKTEYAIKNMEHVSVFISHGEHDTVFPIRIGQETAAYFQGLTSRLTFRTYPSGHGVLPENQRDLLLWLKQDAALDQLN